MGSYVHYMFTRPLSEIDLTVPSFYVRLFVLFFIENKALEEPKLEKH
jgi:hypothetical protein